MKRLNDINKRRVIRGVTAIVCSFALFGCADKEPINSGATKNLTPSFFTFSEDPTRSLVNGTDISATGGKINSVGMYITAEDHTAYLPEDARSFVWELSDQGWNTSTEIKLSNKKALLYTYYPSDLKVTAAANASNEHTVPIEVALEQTFNGANVWECSVMDYLYGFTEEASGTLVDNQNASPKILLKHAMVKLVFKMQNVAGRVPNPSSDYVKRITLSSEKSSFLTGPGVMMIKNGVVGSLGNNPSLTFTPSPAESAVLCGAVGSPSVVAYGLVAPTTLISDDKITITIELGSKDNALSITQSVVSDFFKIDWKAGHEYIYNMSLGDHKIEISEPEIGSWTNTDSGADMKPDGF